ncbi:hypothetical protein D3C76_1163940 [compost metagenome]
MFVFHAQGQAFDAVGYVYGGGCQAGEGLQGVELDLVKAQRIEGIEGQKAPGTLVDKQGAAQAIMHFQMVVQPIYQPIVRVGQVTVAGEAGRLGAAEQCLEARVLTDLEAAPEGIFTQAIDGQWHQPLAIQAQEGGSIAREQGAHGFQQAPIAFAFRQVAGKVADQR